MSGSLGPPLLGKEAHEILSKKLYSCQLTRKNFATDECLKTPIQVSKTLTFGALTLMGPFPSSVRINIFSVPLTTCQNGFKRSAHPPMMARSIKNMESTHRLSTAYHPQTKWQVEVSNRGLKRMHIPIELEHKAIVALKQSNFDLSTAFDHRKVQLNELNKTS
ncbi:reverse transcriptase domain-containing protein [Tanacetum coccineum]